MATAEGDALVLDRDWLEGLVSDDSSILVELTQLFEEQSVALAGMLEQGAGCGDVMALRAAAHKLKGSAASMGLRSLSGQLEGLEKLLDAGGMSQEVVAQRCEGVRRELDAAIGELRDYVELRTKNE
ncbi:MAG: hypothetical protein CSA97_03945 [Bacteroidetes bacterium]|nr:MAG: hypothetical protein CSA97_03945 [Bacteroidota bacterium]